MYSPEEALKVLSEYFDTPLSFNENGTCALKVENSITIFLKHSRSHDDSLIITLVCPIFELPPGVYREKVLLHAFAANQIDNMPLGKMSFIPKNNTLGIHKHVTINEIDDKEFTALVVDFSLISLEWLDAFKQQTLPTLPIVVRPHEI